LIDAHSGGPSSWSGVCQSGNRQSPIDITAASVSVDCASAGLRFEAYSEPLVNYTLNNNGHTVGAKFGSVGNPAFGLAGGALGVRFRVTVARICLNGTVGRVQAAAIPHALGHG